VTYGHDYNKEAEQEQQFNRRNMNCDINNKNYILLSY